MRAAGPGRAAFNRSPPVFSVLLPSFLLFAGIRFQRPVRAKVVLCLREGQPLRMRHLTIGRRHAADEGAAAAAAVTRRRGPLPASEGAEKGARGKDQRPSGPSLAGAAGAKPRNLRNAITRSRREPSRSVSCGLRPAPTEGATARRGFPLGLLFRARCARQWAAASRAGRASMSVINGSARSRQWWAIRRTRWPLTYVN